MRTTCRIAGLVLIGGVVAMLGGPAAANGGAYFDVGPAYQVEGTTAVARYEVAIPPRHLDLLDRGPFHVYLVPGGTRSLEAGRPIPGTAIDVGVATIAERNGLVNVTATFVIPDVRTGGYSLEMCNEPCTLTGFGEPVSGFLTVVGTPHEATLLRRIDELRREAGSATREIRHLEDEVLQLEVGNTSAEARIHGLLLDADRRTARIRTLETTPVPRPLIGDPMAWVAAGVIGLLLGWAIGRRRRRDAHPGLVGADA